MRHVFHRIEAAAFLSFLLSMQPVEACQLTFAPSTASEMSRLAGVEFTMPHAAISDWHTMPGGWSVVVDNDPSWQVHFVGKALVGAAFLDPAAFGVISLQPQSGFSCDVIAHSRPRAWLTFYIPAQDRLRRREIVAAITGD